MERQLRGVERLAAFVRRDLSRRLDSSFGRSGERPRCCCGARNCVLGVRPAPPPQRHGAAAVAFSPWVSIRRCAERWISRSATGIRRRYRIGAERKRSPALRLERGYFVGDFTQRRARASLCRRRSAGADGRCLPLGHALDGE